MKTVRILALGIMIGMAVILSGCSSRVAEPTLRFECSGLPLNARLTLLVRIDGSSGLWREPEKIPEVNELYRYAEGGYVSAEYFLDARLEPIMEEVGQYGDRQCTGLEVDRGGRFDSYALELARELRTVRLAAVTDDGHILKISEELPMYSPEKFAVMGGGSYSFEDNGAVPAYTVPRQVLGRSLEKWCWGWVWAVKLCANGLLLILVMAGSRGRLRLPLWAFWIFSGPTVLQNVLYVLVYWPVSYFSLSTGWFDGMDLIILLILDLGWLICAGIYWASRRSERRSEP